MANFAYTRGLRDMMLGDVHFDTDDIRGILVMTNTTADTEEDAATIDGFTTLDEHDGANYARPVLDSEAVNEDTANDRAEFDATDETIANLGAGTRAIQALVIYKHVSDDTDSIPLFYIDTPAFPNSNGGNYTFQWNAEGIAQLTN